MQGQLFTQDFLRRAIALTPPAQAWDAVALQRVQTTLQRIYASVPEHAALNEAQTEQLIINPVLAELGWSGANLAQVNLSSKGREDVPDKLLFSSAEALSRAMAEPRDDQRWRHGVALLEAKRWLRPLDRGDLSEPTDPGAPSSQMLRYLSRADVVSDRKVKWGVLTNGAVWRLYYQDARSRAEEFFEVDLALALGLPGAQGELDGVAPEHALRLFVLMFGQQAFLPQDWDDQARSFHAYALAEARFYEERVSQDLGERVFVEVFPQLAQALAKGDLQAQTQTVGYGQFTRSQYTPAYLDEVREAALVLLYRLLFLFYAEDRALLPVRDARYREYSVRRLREEVRDKVDARASFSGTVGWIWLALKNTFTLVDLGDDNIGMPAYNGGLFDRARSPLLERTHVTDAVLAPIIDALSRRTEELLRGWINYRDLSVAHLGGIYERLLEYSLYHDVQAEDDYRDKPEINRIVARPASFARKVSGSYYTHNGLVRLVLRESVGLLIAERHAQFQQLVQKLARKVSLGATDEELLNAIDPASTILDITVCDPAMGSGHFLVALVDYLADAVLEAITRSAQAVAELRGAAHWVESGRPWQSPVVARIADIRRSIRGAATQHGWAVTDAQLDDRHIVRRMILKKTIFGVDKNPMAVELAKTALWLHTFTVGAPLSFLDHHLKCGDSLHGERLQPVLRGLRELGMLFQKAALDRLDLAGRNLSQVADLTDVDIAEAQLSKRLADDAARAVAPLHALLDFWRALRWLLPGWPVKATRDLLKLGDEQTRPALAELLSPTRDLVATLVTGRVEGQGAAVEAANALLAQVRELARDEQFFHWWTAFPTVFTADDSGGFDAVIGNPPWDRIKLQQVEWFAEREPQIALQARAADRKALIAALQKKQAPLWRQYQAATERSEANARVLAKAGDYPLLGGGDVNLYSLFVERAQALAAPTGLVALLTPSGIAADKGAAEFFRSISTTGRLGALFDFENKKVFFADVHASFKFSALVFGASQRQFEQARCAFYLHQTDELSDPARVLRLSAQDFALVNPNTGAAPVFRSQRDADITAGIYRRNPVLVQHAVAAGATKPNGERRAWPVKYTTMFHMTNDSDKFLTAAELRAQGFSPSDLNRWRRASDGQEAVPLYEGKMVQMYDHRAADVVVNASNLKRPAQQESIDASAKQVASRYPVPQFFVVDQDDLTATATGWSIAFKSVTAPTNVRTMIAALLPRSGVGNSLALLGVEAAAGPSRGDLASKLLANFNSTAFDFVLRQKVQGQNLNWYVVEQLPVIAPERFDAPLPPAFTRAARAAGLMNGHHDDPRVADFVVPQVLALSYTAHDLAPFARDLGYVDATGQVLAPFVWNAEERRARMAALDALFMHLYGLGADDAAYVLESFPIVRQHDEAAFGRYRTRDDVLAWLAHLAPDSAARRD